MEQEREKDAQVAAIIGVQPDQWRSVCLVDEHTLDDYVWCYDCHGVVDDQERVPEHYSTDIAAAWQVFEWLTEKGHVVFVKGDGLRTENKYTAFTGEGNRIDAATAPEAICAMLFQLAAKGKL